MFGAPESDGEVEVRQSLFERVMDRIFADPDDRPWPEGDDPSVVFLLNERVSPRGMRIRDKGLLLGLILSLLFHVIILSQLRGGSLLESILAAERQAALRKKMAEDTTPFYEFVEMPKQKAEKPKSPSPRSDLDRGAHGGIGAPDLRPGSKGNTPELRVEPPQGGQASPSRGQAGESERAARGSDRGAGDDESRRAIAQANAGADAVLAVPRDPGGRQRGAPVRGLAGIGKIGALTGAMPNRAGGQVDMGPLSFETEWYEWGPYAAEMLRRIRYHWEIPEIAQLGVSGVVRIHFYIERDGHVTGVEIEKGSGHPPMDFAARDAIINASPLPPLPADLIGVDHERVTITFFYNTPVPERTEQG
jgi:TonB family protein